MKWLLLDMSYLAYRAFFTTGHLSYNEVKTGVIYGLMRDISNFQADFRTSHFAFCFDVGKSKRIEIDPQYKANRHKERPEEEIEALQELRSQLKRMRKEYLTEIGYKNIFWQVGYEADDIIASIVRHSLPAVDEAIIISGDQDLYQLLQPNVTIWHPSRRQTITLQSFRKEYKISPTEWKTVKALSGCSSDNIKGIHGVGEKTAIKYIRNELPKNSKSLKIILENADVKERNLQLVELPYAGTKKFNLVDDAQDTAGWERITQRFGMKSLRKAIR